MADNSQQILNDVLTQQRQDRAPEVSEQDYFEVFCAEQILKDFDLSYEEIQAGIVDGEHDGGVDSVYGFVNGELIYEDFDTTSFKKDVRIELHIIQSKTSGGFSEVPRAVQRCRTSCTESAWPQMHGEVRRLVARGIPELENV